MSTRKTSALLSFLANCADLMLLRDKTTKALQMYCPDTVLVDSLAQLRLSKDNAVLSPKFCAGLLQKSAYELNDAYAEIDRLTAELKLCHAYLRLPWYKRLLTTYEHFKTNSLSDASFEPDSTSN